MNALSLVPAPSAPWRSLGAIFGLLSLPAALSGHTIGDPARDGPLRAAPQRAATAPAAPSNAEAAADVSGTLARRTFGAFAPAVHLRTDGPWLVVESNGLPAHGMMVGITAWQQQVPLPQPYTGANAWRVPLHPPPAAEHSSIRDRFLRGAIALPAHGIPSFNPPHNRRVVSLDHG